MNAPTIRDRLHLWRLLAALAYWRFRFRHPWPWSPQYVHLRLLSAELRVEMWRIRWLDPRATVQAFNAGLEECSRSLREEVSALQEQLAEAVDGQRHEEGAD